MPVTAAQLLVKVGWDDGDVDAGAQRTEGKVSALGGKLQAGAMVLGTAVVAGVAAVTGATMKMQDALTPIGTLVGTSSQQFKDLSSGIKDLVANSPLSAEDLGNSAYAILSAGISDTDTALKALKDSGQLAQAGLGSTAEATDLITSAMNSFKGENLDSTKAAETFFGTIASGKTTTSELAQGFGQIAPLAASAGVSFTDLMAATAGLTSTGQKASVAYAGIKGALTGIIKPTAEAEKMAQSLGLEFNQAHLAAVGLPAFLDEVKSATGGNVETMAQLFGSVEGLNSVLALTGPQADAFKANLTGIGAAGQNMQERAKETERTVSAVFALMKNKVMVALSDIGQKGFDALFRLWDKYGPTIKTLFEQVSGGVRAMTAAFVAGNGDVTSSGFAGTMERIGNVARRVVDVIVAAWPGVQEAFRQVGRVLVEDVWPRLQTMFTGYMEAVSIVVGFFQEHWPEISSVVDEVVKTVIKLFGLAKAYFDVTVEAITVLWAKFGDELLDGIGHVFSLIIPIIKNALGVIQGVIDFFTAVLSGNWSAAWTAVKDIVSGVWDTIYSIVRGGIDIVVGLVGAIGGKVGEAVSGAFNGVKQAFIEAINFIIDRWNALEFRIPPFEVFGKQFGGFTLTMPSIGRIGDYAPPVGSFAGGFPAPEPMMLGDSMFAGQRASTVSIGTVNVAMPVGANGADVVHALRNFQRTNGSLPVAVTGRI
jgi:TP901 family phage tail tape measure protein